MNLPSNAGVSSSIPSWGTKTSHVMGQLRPCTTTPEPSVHSSLCTTTREKPIAAGGEAHAATDATCYS